MTPREPMAKTSLPLPGSTIIHINQNVVGCLKSFVRHTFRLLFKSERNDIRSN